MSVPWGVFSSISRGINNKGQDGDSDQVFCGENFENEGASFSHRSAVRLHHNR